MSGTVCTILSETNIKNLNKTSQADLVKMVLPLERCGDSETLGIKKMEGMSMPVFHSYLMNIISRFLDHKGVLKIC